MNLKRLVPVAVLIGILLTAQSARAENKYPNYEPKPETLQSLERLGLPRYLPVVSPEEAFRPAVLRLSQYLDARIQADNADLFSYSDAVDTEHAAKRVDLAFVIEGYMLIVRDGLTRAKQYGFSPLTMGQCAQLLISNKKLVSAIESGVIPQVQCPGTRGTTGIAQVYMTKDKQWVVGTLHQIDSPWHMAVFAGPTTD